MQPNFRPEGVQKTVDRYSMVVFKALDLRLGSYHETGSLVAEACLLTCPFLTNYPLTIEKWSYHFLGCVALHTDLCPRRTDWRAVGSAGVHPCLNYRFILGCRAAEVIEWIINPVEALPITSPIG